MDQVNSCFNDPDTDFCSLNSVIIDDIPDQRESLPEG